MLYVTRQRKAAQFALVIVDPDADPEDINGALDWINSSDLNRLAFERALRVSQALSSTVVPEDTYTVPHPRRELFWLRNGVAAGIAALLIAGMVLLLGQRLFEWDQPTPQTMIYASPIGINRSVALPDGSFVILAGDSQVSTSFSPSERQLRLDKGEALFKVAYDRQRPFQVKAGIGTTTAVGTQFNIHYQQTGATVTVLEGTVVVNVSGTNQRAIAKVGPRLQVSYNNIGAMMPMRQVSIENVIAWQSGMLVFSNTPLMSVVDDLNRYSKQKIIIEDSALGTIPITAAVKIGEIGDWMTALSQILDVDVTDRDGNWRLRQRTIENKPRPSRS